jgi:hypothetical protein
MTHKGIEPLTYGLKNEEMLKILKFDWSSDNEKYAPGRRIHGWHRD